MSKSAQRAYYERNRELVKERSRAWHLANPEKVKESQKKHADVHRKELNAKSRLWQLENPDKNRAIARKSAGLPEPTRPCPAACEACGDTSKRALDLDHNHLTGTFRGWLCNRCNRALGFLKDSPDRCLALARYARGALQ